MKDIEKSYWKLFNRFVKLIGWVFMLGGIYGFIFQTILYFDPELRTVFYNKDYSLIPEELRIFPVLAYGGVALLGYFVIKAKPWKI